MEHFFSGFIGELTGHLNALANAALFWNKPIFLKYNGAWTSFAYYCNIIKKELSVICKQKVQIIRTVCYTYDKILCNTLF